MRLIDRLQDAASRPRLMLAGVPMSVRPEGDTVPGGEAVYPVRLIVSHRTVRQAWREAGPSRCISHGPVGSPGRTDSVLGVPIAYDDSLADGVIRVVFMEETAAC